MANDYIRNANNSDIIYQTGEQPKLFAVPG